MSVLLSDAAWWLQSPDIVTLDRVRRTQTLFSQVSPVSHNRLSHVGRDKCLAEVNEDYYVGGFFFLTTLYDSLQGFALHYSMQTSHNKTNVLSTLHYDVEDRKYVCV